MIRSDQSQIYWNRLTNNLKLIEDLWQKLVYVKWSQESFALLPRLVQDMVNTTRSSGDESLMELASLLAYHINSCVAAGRIPQDMERERLLALLDKLRQILSATEQNAEPITRPWSSTAPIFVVTAELPRALLMKLEDGGFQTRHFSTLADMQAALDQRLAPVAVIIDADQAVQSMDTLRERRALLKAPLFWVAERDDMTARLEAVRRGAAGYFPKPLDIPYLLEKLKNRLAFQAGSAIRHRVLLVDDMPGAAEISALLKPSGLITQVAAHPLHVIQEIHRFQPDLLVVSLELQEASAPELIAVLSQHRAADVLPMILLCSPARLSGHLAHLQLDAADVDLLTRPVAADYLNWLVSQRLRQVSAVRARLRILNHREPASGLYNRGHFLVHLERSVAALGISARSLAMMLITLDLSGAAGGTDIVLMDALIERAAARLRKVLGPQPLAARFGDGAFAVLISDARRETLLTSAQALRDALETEVYEVGERTLVLRTCIGISIATQEVRSWQSLLQQTTLACSLARESKERIYIYRDLQTNGDQEEYQRQSLLSEIQQALEQRRSWLVFQPIVSLRGDPGERYEVLLRMRNRNNEMLFPEAVFNVAQRQPVGVLLDRWVIEQSLELLHERLSAGNPTTLFIKVLPVTLQDRSLRDWLQERLAWAGAAGKQLVFQVVEATAERDLRDMLRFADAVKALGCKLCLERFGRGEDSLGLLKRLPVDYVKFDAYLIQGLADDKSKQARLKEWMECLEPLDTATVVGGIEDMRTLPVLWSYGIQYVQGFFLQRPHEEMSYDFAGYSV